MNPGKQPLFFTAMDTLITQIDQKSAIDVASSGIAIALSMASLISPLVAR
jgi:hypothetical protein